jgi:predicted O-methyltransferase YrrM
MIGVRYDLEAMKQLLQDFRARYWDEFQELPTYEELKKIGYGPGFTRIDAMILYFMLREIKPSHYIEIGSGLSTWYCSVAAERNAQEGKPLQIKCIDPFPSMRLRSTPGVSVVAKEVQDVDFEVFRELGAGDVLFIDSTHIVKIDGDVPYLYLEVLPRLQKGVIIHVHDVHFPFNVPYPPECYIFGGWKWPVFWTEAMLLQAFLCHNDAFRILFSAPLLHFHSQEFLQASIPHYAPIDPANMDTHFGSIWIEKVGN